MTALQVLTDTPNPQRDALSLLAQRFELVAGRHDWPGLRELWNNFLDCKGSRFPGYS